MQRKKRILLVQEDPSVANALAFNLRNEEFDTTIAYTGEEGLTRLARDRPDVMLLDPMLPDMNGLEVCRIARKNTDYVPIIVLSASFGEAHRVHALRIGADDFLSKPFSVVELVARIHALTRRMDAMHGVAGSQELELGALRIDPLSREVRLHERELVLTAKEFDLLWCFALHPGRVFKRAELLDRVWGVTHDGYEHTVNSHINRLRSKIEDEPSNPRRIVTVWGAGYKLLASPRGSRE